MDVGEDAAISSIFCAVRSLVETIDVKEDANFHTPWAKIL